MLQVQETTCFTVFLVNPIQKVQKTKCFLASSAGNHVFHVALGGQAAEVTWSGRGKIPLRGGPPLARTRTIHTSNLIY